MDSKLAGYCHPLSPEGKANLVAHMPWHFSMDVMSFNFAADPEEIAKLLPEPYEPSGEPGSAYVWFSDVLSVADGEKDMIYTNPERTMYKECFFGVRCRVKGVEATKCVYIWVDNDFTLLRGWFYGWPKKLGRIHMSSSKRQLFELNRGIGGFGTGTRLQGFCEAHGERLVTGSMRLVKQISPAELPHPFGLPMLNTIHFPSTDIAADRPLVHQIVRTIVEPPIYGDCWLADDASLSLGLSTIEEHTALRPTRVKGAYFASMSLGIKGTKVVHQY